MNMKKKKLWADILKTHYKLLTIITLVGVSCRDTMTILIMTSLIMTLLKMTLLIMTLLKMTLLKMTLLIMTIPRTINMGDITYKLLYL